MPCDIGSRSHWLAPLAARGPQPGVFPPALLGRSFLATCAARQSRHRRPARGKDSAGHLSATERGNSPRGLAGKELITRPGVESPPVIRLEQVSKADKTSTRPPLEDGTGEKDKGGV